MAKKGTIKDLVERICSYQGDDYDIVSIVRKEGDPSGYLIEIGFTPQTEEE